MKPLMILGLFIMVMVFAQFAHAQTADDVVNKYIAAMGGKEKITSLKTVKLEGNLTVQGTDVVLVITKKHMVGMRMDISVMGTENYQILTPSKGTVFMPVQGMSEPTPMPEEQLISGQSQLDLQGSLVDYKDKGTAIELVGNEKVDGEDCYNLKLTFKSGVVTSYYISTKTSFVIKTNGKRLINGEEMEIATTYSNYKQNADGYWFPYTTTNMQGTTDYSKIDTNVAVDESIFKQ
ncbi:MAG: hypothetical protein WCG67_01190 [Ferruginibacter sp.]